MTGSTGKPDGVGDILSPFGTTRETNLVYLVSGYPLWLHVRRDTGVLDTTQGDLCSTVVLEDSPTKTSLFCWEGLLRQIGESHSCQKLPARMEAWR